MYSLHVGYEDGRRSRESIHASSAEDVLELIPRLLDHHRDCQRIEVVHNQTKLFIVDRAGNFRDGESRVLPGAPDGR